MRASLLARNSPSGREIKVVVASPSNVAKGKAIKFAKKVSLHLQLAYRVRSLLFSATSASFLFRRPRVSPPVCF
jgi:hypothetical protein